MSGVYDAYASRLGFQNVKLQIGNFLQIIGK